MWAVQVVVVVVVAIMSGGVNAYQQIIEDLPDTPIHTRCAREFYDLVKLRLTADVDELKEEIDNVNLNIITMCAQLPDDGPAERAAIIQKLEAIDNKLNQALTKAQVEELLDAKLARVEEAVREAKEACTSDNKMTEVLQEVREVKEDVNNVAALTETTKEEAKRCTQAGATYTTEVKAGVKALKGTIQTMGGEMNTMFELMDNKVEDILNYTSLPPPPPPTLPSPPATTEGPPAPVYPCEDSTFQGTNSYNVCSAAVQHRKCHLLTVSYHCCHTCTTEGPLTDMGPWRHLNMTRVVTTLEVMRFFTL